MERKPPDDNQHEPEIVLQAPETPASPANAEPALPVVYIAEEIVAQMRRHTRSDTSREVAGVLLGEVNPERNTVIVHAAIAAQHTEASRGNVTFTHDTWAQINSEKDSKYPDLSMVGWYHSHPDFGVFLSSYDTFIHRNFFGARWQIAYVLDPVRGDEGCFVWEGEELIRVPDIKLYMDMSAREQTQSEADSEVDGQPIPFTAAADQRRRSSRLGTGEKWALGLVTVLIAMTLMLQIYTGGAIQQVRTELGVGRSELSALPLQLADMSPPTVPRPDSSAPDLAAPAPPLQPEAQVKASDANNTEMLLCDRYQVLPGDTLSGISRQFYGTPEKVDLIAEINGFSRDTELQVGRILLIPRLPDTAAQPDSTPERKR